jgi:hypothetical protein
MNRKFTYFLSISKLVSYCDGKKLIDGSTKWGVELIYVSVTNFIWLIKSRDIWRLG